MMSYTVPVSVICYCSLAFILLFWLKDINEDRKYLEEIETMKAVDEIEELYKNLLHQDYMNKNKEKDATASISDFLLSLRRLISEKKSKKHICPEAYSLNWQLDLCPQEKPLSALVTICIFAFEMTEKDLLTTIKNLHKQYKYIPIIVAIGIDQISKMENSYITYVKFQETRNRLRIWNSFIILVKTPYIYLGRGFSNLGHYTDLTRAIHTLSGFSSVDVVSFGNLNKDRIWKIDCFQVILKNYELRIVEGYKRSFSECTVCGYVNGPFMMKSSTLKKYELDMNLVEEDLGFLDLFLRLKKDGKLIVSCPDMMTLVSRPSTVLQFPKKSWLPFVQKWEVNELKEPNGTSLQFSCVESSISCDLYSYTKDGIKVPLCCLRATSKLLQDFVIFSNKYRMHFEIDTGAALAAVKMSHALPWDLDLDGDFHKDNISTFVEHRAELHQMGYGTRDENHLHFINVFWNQTELKGVNMDIWTLRPHVSIGNVHTGHFEPTRIMFDGFLVNVPYNPGLFVRNRYGKEIYRHSPSWMVFHRKDSYADYIGGEAVSCKKPDNPACMGTDELDGNLEPIEERS